MKYTLNFKATEYTDETEAATLNEAAQIFYNRMPYEGKEQWTSNALKRHIWEEREPEYDPVEELEKKLPVNI